MSRIFRTKLTIPSEIDPYEVLQVTKSTSFQDCKEAFFKQICNPNRHIRTNACLAYDMLCNKDKYTQNGKKFTVKNKDHFYCVVVGDLDELDKIIQQNKNLLNDKDELERSLLYLAARNGYFNICQYLLKKGCNVNEPQKDGSTPLHGAAYYGQELIVQLLLEYGANTKIKNQFNNLPMDHSRTISIKNYIENSDNDQISILLNKLIKKKLATNMVTIKRQGKVIGKKIMKCAEALPYNINEIKEKWIPVWHGTKLNAVESIMQYGLLPSGTKLTDGKELKPMDGHINLNVKIAGDDIWAKAIFVSPSIFYAADAVYAERINSNKERWSVLVEGRVRPGTFSSHTKTVPGYNQIPGEPDVVEYRVKVNDDSEHILRVESKKNVVITSVLFASCDFLEHINEYNEGNSIYIQKRERIV